MPRPSRVTTTMSTLGQMTVTKLRSLNTMIRTRWRGDDEDLDTTTGVREPRRPYPSDDKSSVALEEPEAR